MSFGAVILAAGGSRRFGSSPKQLARLRGRPLLQHAIDAAVATPALTDVVVVLGARADEVAAAIDLGRARAIRCPRWPDGLAASLQSGAAALAPTTTGIVVLLGDQPGVTPALIERLLGAHGTTDPEPAATRATYAGVPGHPVLLGAAILVRLGALDGDRGARDLLHGREVLRVPADDLTDGADVDTPADLAALDGTAG